MGVEVRLFGSLEVRVDGRVLGARDFGGRKPKQLLEILLLHGGRSMPKEQLAGHLWGERAPANFAAALEHYVSVLRRRLGPDGSRRDSLIVTEHGGYRFDTARAWVDVLAFDEACGHRTADPVSRELLEFAVALVGGELVEDEPYAEWATKQRAHYRQRHVQLLVAAGEAALADRDAQRAGELADLAIEADPLAEAVFRLMMLASYVRGDQHAALRAFERCRRTLAAELGVDPLPETARLYEAILNQVPAERLLPGGGAAAAHGRTPAHPPAGPVVRLVPDPAGPTDGLAADPAGLPFLGRTAELAAVLAHCAAATGAGAASVPAGTGVTTIIVDGEAGVGKTRLLDEVAQRVVDRQVVRLRCAEEERDLPGSLLVDAVRAMCGGGRLPRTLLDALGTLGDAGPAGRTALVAHLTRLFEEHSPFVLLVDDAQWCDPTSVVLLGWALRRSGAAGVLLFAGREAEMSGDHPLRQVEPCRRISLAPFTAEELAPLGVPGLHERTGGLPFNVVRSMVARSMAAGGRGKADPGAADPDPVLARLARLGDGVLRLVVVAAVVPSPFGPEEVARLLGRDVLEVAEELDRMCRLQVLRVVGDAFAFRYDAAREALLGTVSPARRRLSRLHHRHPGSRADRRQVGQAVPGIAERRRPVSPRRRSAEDAGQLAQ